MTARARCLGSLGGFLLVSLLPIHADAKTLVVGPGQTYAKPCQAIAAAAAGDVIEVDAAGSYSGDTCAWGTDNLTIRGVNGRAKIDLTGVSPAQKKGIFTISAPTATIENFELSGAAISAADGNNGAGIRHQGLNLTVRGCFFHDNQNGILGAPSAAQQGTVLIEGSEFANNGAGDGYSHNMYMGNYAKFTLQGSYSHRGKVGHLVKSRAKENYILYNRITDEAGGTASYEIDLPNGGLSVVLGNLIEQSSTTQNPAMVAYAAEGLTAGYDARLFVVNNTFLNNRGSGTFVTNPTATPGVLRNNIFWNGGTVSSQASAEQTSNFVGPAMGDPLFTNVAAYDVRLRMGSPCIDVGTAAGSAGSQSLTPAAHYVHPLQQQARQTVGSAIDIGAYEYGQVLSPPDGGGGSSDDGGTGGGGGGGGSTPGGCSCNLGQSRGVDPLAGALWLGSLLAIAYRLRRRTARAT